MFTKQKNVYDVAFNAWPFSSDFNFVHKDGRFNTATCKYYCQLFISPTITNSCKNLHLKCDRVPRSIFENIAMQENWYGLVWKPVFFLLFQNVPTFIESHFVSLCYFLPYDEVYLISLLDVCYHYLVFMDPVNGCPKSKLLVKL